MKYIIAMILCFWVIKTQAQVNTEWVQVEDDITAISFSLPSSPIKYDTLQTVLYAAKIDSTIALEIHVFTGAKLNANQELLQAALTNTEGDTLRAIAEIMLLATNGELSSIEDITTSNIQGLEMSFRYRTLASDVPCHTFVRYYLAEGRFYALSVTTTESEIVAAYAYKNQFFNSLQFNF